MPSVVTHLTESRLDTLAEGKSRTRSALDPSGDLWLEIRHSPNTDVCSLQLLYQDDGSITTRD